jgi:hypothetical protein
VRSFLEASNAGKRRWRVSHALAVVSVGLLAAIVTPGCAWLFGFPETMPVVTAEPGGGPSGGGLIYPAPPPEVADMQSHFVAPEAGYRGLGGIFVYDGRLTIIPAWSFDPLLQKNDVALNLAFGHLVAEHHIDPLKSLTEADCIGAGDGADTTIVAQKVATPDDEVAAGIACARLRNPGAHWIASKLMVSAKRGVAFHLLEYLDGRRIGVYTDVTRFARQGGVLQER